jgi:hypothetical protein
MSAGSTLAEQRLAIPATVGDADDAATLWYPW